MLFSKLKPNSVHGKFLLFLIILTIIPFVIAISALEWLRYQDGYNKLLAKLDQLSASQSILLAEAVANRDQELIRLSAASTISDPDVINAMVRDQNGALLGSFGVKHNQQNKLCRTRSISYANHDLPQKVGFLTLCLTDRNVISGLRQRFYERGLLLAIFLLVIFSAYLALRFTVGIALSRLLHSIKSAEEQGVLVPVKWQSNDELGQVVAAYNAMQYRHEGDVAAVRLAHDQLEQRVEERTKLLSREISARKEVERELTYQASHDPLTNLINRREFEKRLTRVLKSARNSRSVHALCYLDLDQFKIINDTCGHAAGDELLRQVAPLLTQQLRERDTLGRLGGW